MLIIDAVNFRGVDLNLLVGLRVLLVERHVTRSAERLGTTQPAMSASLMRLRTLFRDQLLVRGPKGMGADASGPSDSSHRADDRPAGRVRASIAVIDVRVLEDYAAYHLLFRGLLCRGSP